MWNQLFVERVTQGDLTVQEKGGGGDDELRVLYKYTGY
jgi:hypothetical protein